VTIYDGDTPDLDMWMVFNTTSGWYGTNKVRTTGMMNGKLAVGANSTGVVLYSFISDDSLIHYVAGYHFPDPTIINRNNHSSYASGMGGANLVDRFVNDIAMTVLPNAPIDSATGLPILTIAVATNGGVSVIKDDGNVWDLTDEPSARPYYKVAMSETQVFGISVNNATYQFWDMPTQDQTAIAGKYSRSKSVDTVNTPQVKWDGNVDNDTTQCEKSEKGNWFSSVDGLSVLKENLTTPAEGSVAYITSDYNSGYMTGDIKGAWLSDTDTTNAVGTELVTNGTFDSDANWTKGSGWTISGGNAVATNVSSGVLIQQSYTISSAGYYILSMDVLMF